MQPDPAVFIPALRRAKSAPALAAALLTDVRREGSRFDLHLRTRYEQE